jgi:hypothetical protein
MCWNRLHIDVYCFEGCRLGLLWLGRAEDGKIVLYIDPIKIVSTYVGLSGCVQGSIGKSIRKRGVVYCLKLSIFL